MGIFDKIRGRRDSESALRARDLVRRGEALQHEGLIGEALRVLQQANQLDPENADAYYGLGRCYHHFARDENERAGGTIYFKAGLEFLDKAIAVYERLLLVEPGAADALLCLGLAYDNRSRLGEAERCYREAIRRDPSGMDGADAHMNLALLLYMRAIGWAGLTQTPGFSAVELGDAAVEAAFVMGQRGIEIGERIVKAAPGYLPNLLNAHRQLGRWLDRSMQGGRAVEHFQAIIRLSPADQEAREWLAQAERNTGRKLL